MTANPDGVRLLADNLGKLFDTYAVAQDGGQAQALAKAALQRAFWDNKTELIAALRAAPVPQCDAEPVAWRYTNTDDGSQGYSDWKPSDEFKSEPLYAAPSRLDAGSVGVIEAARALMVEVERTADSFDWLAPIADLRLALALAKAAKASSLSPDFSAADANTNVDVNHPSSNGKPATENEG